MPANTMVQTFRQPEYPDGKVWRYMEPLKLLNIITDKKLLFPKLKLFKDKWEGTLTDQDKQLFLAKVKGLYPDGVADHLKQQMLPLGGTGAENVRISCWHMNDHESAAMWDLYGSGFQAVAIQTTYAKLVEYFPERVVAGAVSYIDYKQESFPENQLLAPFAHKRKSFEHEREVRFVHIGNTCSQGMEVCEYGTTVHFDINDVIEHIYVSPEAPSWIEETIRKTCVALGVRIEVVKSDLYSQNIV